MLGAKLKGHWTKNERADHQQIYDNLKTNYDELDATVPEKLTGYAKDEWLRLIPILRDSVPVSSLDRFQLINYCLLAQTVQECQTMIETMGLTVDAQNGVKTNPYFTIQDKAIRSMRLRTNDSVISG